MFASCTPAWTVGTLHSRWRPEGSGADLFERVHDELAGDAWLVGRVTGQEFAKGKPYPASTKETFPRAPWFARRDAKAYGIVLDAHGKIGWGRSEIGGDPIVVVLSEAVYRRLPSRNCEPASRARKV